MDLITLYQEKGLSFFPLRKKSKRPLYDWARFQEQKPSPDEVAEWREKGLLGQVAVVCGAVSGIIVLDVDDPEKFEAWIKEKGYGLPPSPQVRTSGEKYHVYFAHPGGRVKNAVKRIPGGDIKGDGGYVVAPPSLHPNGGAYEWSEFLTLADTPLAPPPPWLLEFIETEVVPEVELTQESQLPPEEDWVAIALKGVLKGQRNNTATKLAGYYLARGEPEPRVLQLLQTWNLANKPVPLPAEDIQATVASIARKEARKRIRTEAGEGKPSPVTDLPAEEQRMAEIQGLGERLDIPLTDIRVTKSDDSIFEFFLGEADSVVIPATQLVDQRQFIKKFFAAGLMIPKKIMDKNGTIWHGVVKQMTRLAIYQDMGPESTQLGELKEFLNSYVENYRALGVYSPNEIIPSHIAFFIVQRKNEKPKLYARLSEIFLEARMHGYKSVKKMSVLMPSLGHEPERFRWNRQTIRAWNMGLGAMTPEIKEIVYKKAAEAQLKAAEEGEEPRDA